MTDEMMHYCERQMKEAIESGEQGRIWQAFAGSFAAMMECQHKTRGTQKEMNKEMTSLRSDMVSVKSDVKDMKASHTEFQALKERGKGAAWMGRIALVAGGGFVYDVILRIIEHFSK